MRQYRGNPAKPLPRHCKPRQLWELSSLPMVKLQIFNAAMPQQLLPSDCDDLFDHFLIDLATRFKGAVEHHHGTSFFLWQHIQS